MGHRLQQGGVPATYSIGLVLQTSHQDDFLFCVYPQYFHAHSGNLPEISLRPLTSIYCLAQTQKAIIRSTPDFGG